MTLSVLEVKGRSPIASLFKYDILYLWHFAWSLCICRASYFYRYYYYYICLWPFLGQSR